MRQKFPEGRELLVAYSPDCVSDVMMTDKTRIYEGSSPELNLICEAYGEDFALSWLEIQIQHIFEFNRDSLQPWALTLTATLILSQFGYLKLSELMLFFGRLMSGAYGRFFNGFNPQDLMSRLHMFLADRNNDLDAINRERALIARQQAQEAERPYLMTSGEWDRLRATLTREQLQQYMKRPG